jgi:hypothetical protein
LESSPAELVQAIRIVGNAVSVKASRPERPERGRKQTRSQTPATFVGVTSR